MTGALQMATQIPKIHIIAYIPALPKVAYIWCSTSWPQIHSFGICIPAENWRSIKKVFALTAYLIFWPQGVWSDISRGLNLCKLESTNHIDDLCHLHLHFHKKNFFLLKFPHCSLLMFGPHRPLVSSVVQAWICISQWWFMSFIILFPLNDSQEKWFF